MSQIEAALSSAVTDGHSPGIVGIAATRDGVVHESAHGMREVGGDAPMTTDSVFRIFSMTKAIGTAAAVKLIEQGRLTPDTPVADILPDWNNVQVLEGFDGDTPILRAPKTTATVRHLATHCSGLVYEFWNANQGRYLEATGAPSILTGSMAALQSYPLAFEPGTGWGYGIGIDWLGRMVEEIAGERIDAFCQREIFDPLGMKDTAFEPREDMKARLVSAHAATPEGFVVTELAPPPNPELYGMGHCLYSTGPDYMRFIHALLTGGGALFDPETVEMLSRNHIGMMSMPVMHTEAPPVTADVDMFPGTRKTYSLGFMRNEEDIPGKRRAGSQSWAGVLNTHYWWDPAAGIAGLFMLQHIPFVDPHCMAVYDGFERAVYAELG